MDKNLNARVSATMKTIRLEQGISQEDLADMCELHRTYIGAIERGERNITLNTLEKICDALGCPVFDLLAVAQ